MTLRRTSFGRAMLIRKPPTAMALARRVGLGLEVSAPRASVMADCSTPAQAIEKHPRAENPHLLRMARGKPCLLNVHDWCKGIDGSTTVACHQNEGKGMARKQDDFLTVQGCAPCHEWLDRSGAPRAQKREAFTAAHLRQVLEWRAIVADLSQAAKDRAAARWALDHLNATPVGLESPL